MNQSTSTKKTTNVSTLLLPLALLLIMGALILSGCTQNASYPQSPAGQQQTQAPMIPAGGQTTATNSDLAASALATDGFVSFNSTASYEAFASSYYNSQSTLHYGPSANVGAVAQTSGSSDMIKEAAAPQAASPASAADSASGDSQDYSQTNNQVAGVDEADSTKTDGHYIYTITDNTVYIINAYPGANASIVSSFVVGNNSYTNPSDLLVSNDSNTLVVLGNQYNYGGGWFPNSGESYAYLYDISDKANPTLKENLTFEGSYFQARLKDDYVYFVDIAYPQYRDNYPLPILYKNGVESQIPVDRIFYHPIYDYQSPALVQIQSINLGNGNVQSTALTVESTQVMYMSLDNIYLTYTQNVDEYQIEQDVQQSIIKPYLTSDENALINRINAVDTDILSPYEKKSKISDVYYERLSQLSQDAQNNISDEVKIDTKKELATYNYFEFTVINKLSYQDGVVTPVATAKIPGSVNDQFALDEASDGTLRVATTVHEHWSIFDDSYPPYPTVGSGGGIMEPIAVTADASTTNSASGTSNSGSSSVAVTSATDANAAIIVARPPIPAPQNPTQSQNMVFTLDSELKPLGNISGIAVGEQIYAARFDGDRLYLTTFEQVDPFSVIDLSDAANPKILGQLNLSGFSRYLHPIGNDLVVGLGQDADPTTGRVGGLKISLFNVSDVAHPVVISSYTGTDDYAYSTALFDHHAFLLAPQKDLLVIPVEYSDWQNQNKNYAGALVFHIDNSSIALRGLIDHTKNGNDVWNAQVERSLYINDSLYTKSRNLLRINDINTLQSIKDIPLGATYTPDITVY